MKPGSIIQMDWHSSRDGSEVFRAILQPNTYKRNQFGFLERPNLPPSIEEVSFKIFVCGKSKTGKTSTIARLAGVDQKLANQDTTGINVTVVYWPVKLISTSKVLLFRLEFWDASELSLKKFKYILSSCIEEVKAVLFLFSFGDRTSFEELPNQMAQILPADKSCCPMVIGTRCDSHTVTDVTSREVREFEQRWNIPVIRIKNILPESHSTAIQKTEFSETEMTLNIICEQLCFHHKSQRDTSLIWSLFIFNWTAFLDRSWDGRWGGRSTGQAIYQR